MPVPKGKAKVKQAVKAAVSAKVDTFQPKKHTTAEGEKSVCWFYHSVYDTFGIPHTEMQNEASVLNMIAAKLSFADCELLVRAIRALKNKETS